MDATLRSRAEQLATEFAGQATTAADLNGLMRLMMKSALERMLNTELDVHLGRKALAGGADADQQPGERTGATEFAALTGSAGNRSPSRRKGRSKKPIE